jgi:crotonobetainyl-CoA:carnitine CoA-transferase CaiB-like acyl-CoA transferase
LPKDPKFSKTALRYANRAELREILQEVIVGWECASLLAELAKVTVPAGRVNTVSEALSDEQAEFRQMVLPMAHPLSDNLKVLASPIRLSRTPPVYDQPPPLLGEHSESVLNRWLGMSPSEVGMLREQGAL